MENVPYRPHQSPFHSFLPRVPEEAFPSARTGPGIRRDKADIGFRLKVDTGLRVRVDIGFRVGSS